ncbi:IS1595 family transposase (InsA domain) [Campylobacter iguaniorum]|uniref:IS1595-like element ISCig1 family transposase n=1 Tax=Campylobacter iguaniorum TaxID=1244531 RepID=UPI0007C8ADD8|nr:IS1595-like element ISCig1 family transposase [Campylobacter iguaniorum]ANE35595.1 IS1595 family transposase (InsA domain) [Campylobacter iguaniorum]
MATSNVELEIVKQLFSTLSDDDKKSFLKSIKSKKQEQNFTFTKKIKECPHCKSTHFVKNGKVQGRQRFICMDCYKTFAQTNNTILYCVKKDLSVWEKYIHCMIEKYSLRKTAQICGISLPTAFAWRHKILDALQEIQENVKLDGIIETDETFMPISYKGHHKDFNFPRSAKHRGTTNTNRGLSKELVCIPCAVNLNGKSVAKIANLGKPNVKALNSVIFGKVEKESVFVTNSLRSYLKLSNEMNLNHIRIPRNKHSNGSFNIQVVNNYHSRLKSMLVYNFKGVSTKYLNNYLVYHNFVNFAKESRKDKEQMLLNHILNTNCLSQSISVANRPAVPLLVA